MRTKIHLVVAFVALSLAAQLGAQAVNVMGEDVRVQLPDPNAEFVIPRPDSYVVIRDSGPMLISFFRFEGKERGIILYLVRDPRAQKKFLILAFEIRRLDELSRKDFEARLEMAKYKREVSNDLAAALYEQWIVALLHVRYGRTEVGSGTDYPVHYIAAHTVQTGCMVGFSEGAITPNSEVAAFSELGTILWQFAQGEKPSDETVVVNAIRRLALRVPAANGVPVAPSGD
jgi:hypothetical protein